MNSVSLIPNPTLGKAVLEMNFQQYHNVQIVVLNNIGETIIASQAKEIQSELFELDLTSYSPGLYLVKVSVDGRVVTKRLVLSK